MPKPASDRISTRTRRRTATAAGVEPPAVDYGFGPGGAPRPSPRRTNIAPRVPGPQPGPPTATTLTPATSAVPTVPIPSVRGCAEAVGTPLLRLPTPLGDTSPAPARLDADGDAAEVQFADSVARYSHADWMREQEAEPTCHAAMRYIALGRPSTLPADFLSCYPTHKRPSFSDIQELAGKGRLHTTDDFVLLVRNPTPPPPRSAEPSSVGRAACLLNDEPFASTSPYSCALGSCKVNTRRFLATLAPNALRA